MKKRILAALVLAVLLLSMTAFAEETEQHLTVTTEYRTFISQYRHTRDRKVSYYDNVYCVNHGKYGLTPFDSKVPEEYFIVDDAGYLSVSPLVMDITDAMRVALYGGDFGDVAMYYGQYCERQPNKYGHLGFTGVHEGVDFVFAEKMPLHAIIDGVVTRAGDRNGTVGIYSEKYDVTFLYLHCRNINVRRGDEVKAGDQIATEGDKKAGGFYTHVEMRNGRHTSSNPYRDVNLQSDCPYAVMQDALGVEESGRMPITYASYQKAIEMRREAEAAAATAAALESAEAAQPEEVPQDIELVDTLPGGDSGLGFDAPETPATEAPETPAVDAPEATLPPSNP